MSSLNGFEYLDPVTGQIIRISIPTFTPDTVSSENLNDSSVNENIAEESDENSSDKDKVTEVSNTSPDKNITDSDTNSNELKNDNNNSDDNNSNDDSDSDSSNSNTNNETENSESQLPLVPPTFESIMGIPASDDLGLSGMSNQQAMALLQMMFSGGMNSGLGEEFDMDVPNPDDEHDEYDENETFDLNVPGNSLNNEEDGIPSENNESNTATEGIADNNEQANEENGEEESEDDEPVEMPPLLQQLLGIASGAGAAVPGAGAAAGNVMMMPMGGMGGLMSLLGQTRTNYYTNANEQFTWLIGDNDDAKKLYNCCCMVMMGHNRDFVGRFTDEFLRSAHEILEEFYPHIIGKLHDIEAEFFDNIYVPVIKGLYVEYRRECDIKAKKALEACIGEFESGDEIDDCCICISHIDEGKYAKLPCNHSFHYDCVRTWFSEQLICPTCRYCFEKGKAPKDKKEPLSNSSESSASIASTEDNLENSEEIAEQNSEKDSPKCEDSTDDSSDSDEAIV